MGASICCCVDRRSIIDKELDRNRAPVVRLVILGAGESGKTTVMRQFKLLDSENKEKKFTDATKTELLPFILFNVIEGAYQLLNHQRSTNNVLESPESREAAKLIWKYYLKHEDNSKMKTKFDGLQFYPEEIGNALRLLSNDKEFMDTHYESSALQVPDGWPYYMKTLRQDSQWGSRGWMPSTEDIIHVRQRTSGINAGNFVFGKVQYTLVDVGGQTVERQKWAHVFESSLNGVIYMQPLSDFDQVMFENPKKNRLEDSLELWKKVNKDLFADKTIIVFLNKVDLLERKFIQQRGLIDPALGSEKNPSPVYNESLSPADNKQGVITWYKDMMLELVEGQERQSTISFHVMSAVVTDNIHTIVQAVFINEFSNQLMTLGLVPDDTIEDIHQEPMRAGCC